MASYKGFSLLRWIVLLTDVFYCHGTFFCQLLITDCSQFQTSCTVHRDDNCSGSHLYDGSATSYPGPVTSFHAITRPVDVNPTRSSLQVTWKLPHNDTHKYLSGFEVKIWSVLNPDRGCFIYNLAGSLWSEPTSKYQYVHTCASLTEGQYDVEVVSLPRSNFSDVKESAIVRVIGRNRDCNRSLASCWTTDIVVYNRPCDKRLHVQFQLAPDETRISHYLVSLIYENSLFPDASLNVSHVSSETIGYATLNVTQQLPLNQRIVMVRPQGTICDMNACLISATEPFNIVDPTEKECTFNYSSPSVQPTALSKVALGGIISGSVLLTGVIICMVVLIARETAEKEKVMSIYVMYSYDNPYHKQVVNLFVDFLRSVSSCNVIYDKRHLDRVSDTSPWVKGAMEICDAILLVTSEGCYRRSVSIRNDETYPSARHDRGSFDLFSPAYRILENDSNSAVSSLINKLILVHFPYTLPQYRVLDTGLLRCSVNHQLMKDVEEVDRLINGSGSKRLNPIQLLYHKLKLTSAIKRTTNYIQSNPNWFTDIYGQPVPTYDVLSTDMIRAETTRIDDDVARANRPTDTSPGDTNLTILNPGTLDDSTTINSSILDELVDDINLSRKLIRRT